MKIIQYTKAHCIKHKLPAHYRGKWGFYYQYSDTVSECFESNHEAKYAINIRKGLMGNEVKDMDV
jgi:hypothetical protein